MQCDIARHYLRLPQWKEYRRAVDRIFRSTVMRQPCRVCGETAAGFHFGAFTCEGCKSFFGRSCQNPDLRFECKNGGNCVIDKKTRTTCKACRLNKCHRVGMSKMGSRYGRRSNSFKMSCTIDAQEQLMNQNVRENIPGPSAMPHAPAVDLQDQQRRINPAALPAFFRSSLRFSPWSPQDRIMHALTLPSTSRDALSLNRIFPQASPVPSPFPQLNPHPPQSLNPLLTEIVRLAKISKMHCDSQPLAMRSSTPTEDLTPTSSTTSHPEEISVQSLDSLSGQSESRILVSPISQKNVEKSDSESDFIDNFFDFDNDWDSSMDKETEKTSEEEHAPLNRTLMQGIPSKQPLIYSPPGMNTPQEQMVDPREGDLMLISPDILANEQPIDLSIRTKVEVDSSMKEEAKKSERGDKSVEEIIIPLDLSLSASSLPNQCSRLI